MSKILIYSCIFIKESLCDLFNLLLITYKLFGCAPNNVDYLVICDPNFKEKINHMFNSLSMNYKVWFQSTNSIMDATCMRLNIFDYSDIKNYNKILYLDVDILITNNLKNILDIQLENKLYALKEGNTEGKCWGNTLYNNNNNPKKDAFTTGILLFNNNNIIKTLFNNIKKHIKTHISQNLPMPAAYDQPFIIYTAINNNLYNNTRLVNIAINNPKKFNQETLSHFPGGVGNYERKIILMSNYLRDIMFNSKIKSNILVPIDHYRKIIEDNNDKFKTLDNICKQTGELLEGNCFTEHLNINNKIHELVYKQMNHFSLGKIATNIMEIGFNAGHSSLLYLLSNPKCKLTLFDLCEHKYTQLCFNYLNTLFPNRLTLYSGDSTITIPNFIKQNPTKKFDLIHIDGGHLIHVATLDFNNSLKLASDTIIFDDTQIPVLNNLFNEKINSGFVYEINLYETLKYKHRICKVNPVLNNTYSWGTSTIKFLSQYKMEAFGNGTYVFLDSFLIKATFGGHTHMLNFDHNYKSFIAIRQVDNIIVKGILI